MIVSPRALIATLSKKLSTKDMNSLTCGFINPEQSNATKNHRAKYGKFALMLDFSPMKNPLARLRIIKNGASIRTLNIFIIIALFI